MDISMTHLFQSDADPPEGFKMTELGPLPEEWELVRLGEVASFETGKREKGGAKTYGEVFSIGGEHITEDGRLDLSNSKPKFISKNFYEKMTKGKVRSGDTLVCKDGARTGKSAFVRDIPNAALAVNEHVFIVRPLNTRLQAGFLGCWFLSEHAWQQIRAAYHGLIGGITREDISSFWLPLPPLPEQRAIAHVLRTVQRAKEATERVIQATRELKKSLMRHLFTYGFVPVEEAERVSLKETEIGLVPEHWEVTALGRVVVRTQYGISQRGSVDQGRYPILRMNNLEYGSINLSNLQYVDLDEELLTRFRLNKGDLLFNRTNSYELVGKTALFDLPGDYVFASYLIRVVPNESRLDPRFLNYYLNAEATQARLKSLASRGVSQSNINATKLRGFQVPLPPLPEQREIVRTLRAVDKKLQTEEARKQSLDALFKTLLHYLMTGKVRVKDLRLSKKDEVM